MELSAVVFLVRTGPLGIPLSWGGLQKHGVKNKFEFLTLFWDTPKMAQSQGFSTTTPLLDQKKARTRRSKTCQKYPRTHVHRCASSGKDAGSEGRIHTHAPVPRMRRKWVPWVTNPTPPTKGCWQPGPKKVKKSVRFFFALKNGSACGPSTVFFFHKIFRTFFHSVARGFFCTFFTIFSLIFSHYFSHCFSHRIFRTSLLHIFLTHLFRAVCCPQGFHSLQPQHCVTVPETGHTTTCRSSPSLLTQYSHKQVV